MSHVDLWMEKPTCAVGSGFQKTALIDSIVTDELVHATAYVFAMVRSSCLGW